MALDEFALIQRYFARRDLTAPAPAGLVAGIGDDCALLWMDPADELAFSMDLLVEGVHFPTDCDARLLGQRALRVNLSDLAAMGAEPLCFTLGLVLPEADEPWLEAFSRGLAEVAQESACVLVGGDVTRGPLTICIQVHGKVPRGRALRRSGAAPGDDVYVTGTLGDAAAALPFILDQRGGHVQRLPYDTVTALRKAYYSPVLQIRHGLALRGLASAAIDLSDGLASDLQHILDASDAGATIELGRLPLSAAFRQAVPEQEHWPLAVRGGDDYGLCFTAPAVSRNRVETLLEDLGAVVHRIGCVDAEPGLRWLGPDGTARNMGKGGYRHFSGE
ncbi:MAG: thiamine-phosphate kinase [Pseudohongiellaceae bacterium]